MVKIVEGDIFESDAGFIVHQVNCQGVMGSGIAKSIRLKFYNVYTEYKELVNMCDKDPKHLLGKVLYVPGHRPHQDEPIIIANLFGQDKYGYNGACYTDYEALRKGFKHIAEHVPTIPIENKKIAIPFKIGCCRGGGDWSIVYKMIHDELSDLDVTIYKLPEVKGCEPL